MKLKKPKKLPSILIVTLVAVVLALSVTLASIYTQVETVNRIFTVSNLAAKVDVTFNGVSNMSQYTTQYGITASADSSQPNYIGNLRVNVQYRGRGVGLIRVHLVEEWSRTETVSGNSVRTVQPYRLDIPYTLPANKTYTLSGSGADSGNQAKWLDNRAKDYCYYYATPVYSTSGNTWKTIQLITGVDDTAIDFNLVPSGTDLHIIAEADVVQVNRYPQYWGITALPWNAPNTFNSDAELS